MKQVARQLLWPLIVAFPLLFIQASCIKENGEEPLPSIDDLRTQFPALQQNIVQWQGYDFTRFQAIWMQQLAGVRGRAQLADRYELQPEHLDDSWNVYYLHCLHPLIQAIEEAKRLNAPGFAGIGYIMQAYTLGLMTDVWGDLPYSSVLHSGLDLPEPVYDQQESIIAEIFSLLDRGVEMLGQPVTDPKRSPDTMTDLIYQGNAGKWEKAAGMIRLRYMLRLAHREGDYASLLQAFNTLSLFTSNEDNMLFRFDPTSYAPNPFYQFEQQVRNTRVGKYFADLLRIQNDPRQSKLIRINTEGEYIGSAPGENNFNASFLGRAIASELSPMMLISYSELQFIKAEVFWRNNMQSQADEAFRQGMVASLDYYDVRDAEWEAIYADVPNVGLFSIMLGKYVALYLQPEVWSDYRRTGYPQLRAYMPAEHVIPRRMIYPETELQHNTDNVPPDIGLFDRVWWDELTE